MEARAKLLGHPLHQMLIVLPLGLLSGAVIFDALHLLVGNPHWPVVAWWLIPAGVIAGAVAAVFGVVDWLAIPRDTRAHRIGLRHGGANALVLVLFAVSWLVRGEPAAAPGALAYLLSFAGGGLSLVSGWLGGELVGRLTVGVDDGAHLNAPSSLSGPAERNIRH